jgi:hypothetical protein
VRCRSADGKPGKALAAGRVQVERDAATRRVTKRAPELELDLDGRKYTAMYQTLLPRVRLRLPGGAGAADSVVRVQGPSSTRELRVGSAGLELASGTFGEGTHSLSIVQGTRAVGKPTTLVIQFDNSAPAAYLDGGDALEPAPDGALLLRGAALEHSQLSLEGQPIALDHAARFEARIRPAADARGVGLWIRHPRLGSHHYVRRIRGRSDAP